MLKKGMISSALGLCLIVAVSILILVAGCSKRPLEESKIIISIASVYSTTDPASQLLDKAIDKFMEENPDIKVKKIWITQNYTTKILTMIAGGTIPDIFRAFVGELPIYLSKGFLMPLDDFFKDSKVLKPEDFFPVALYKYRFDGEVIGRGSIYGFGTDWSPDFALFFNKTMFDNAGIAYPTKSLSWEEFREIARKLTYRDEKEKQFGCMLSPGDDLPVLVYQNGGRVFSEDGKRCLLDFPEAIEAFRFLTDLMIKDKVTPTLSEGTGRTILQLFQMGKLGMFLCGRFYVPIVQQVMEDSEWGVAPALHNKKRLNMVAGPHGFVMSRKTNYPKEAWKLMEQLMIGDYVKGLAKAGYGIPTIKKIAYSELFLNNPDHPEGLNRMFLDEVRYAVSSPLTPYVSATRWKRIIIEEVDLVSLGKQTAKEAACKATKRINTLMEEKIRHK